MKLALYSHAIGNFNVPSLLLSAAIHSIHSKGAYLRCLACPQRHLTRAIPCCGAAASTAHKSINPPLLHNMDMIYCAVLHCIRESERYHLYPLQISYDVTVTEKNWLGIRRLRQHLELLPWSKSIDSIEYLKNLERGTKKKVKHHIGPVACQLHDTSMCINTSMHRAVAQRWAPFARICSIATTTLVSAYILKCTFSKSSCCLATRGD